MSYAVQFIDWSRRCFSRVYCSVGLVCAFRWVTLHHVNKWRRVATRPRGAASTIRFVLISLMDWLRAASVASSVSVQRRAVPSLQPSAESHSPSYRKLGLNNRLCCFKNENVTHWLYSVVVFDLSWKILFDTYVKVTPVTSDLFIIIIIIIIIK